MGEAGVVADVAPDRIADPVQLRRLDCVDATAALAVEVPALAPAGEGVEPRPVPEMDVPYDASSLERFEVAIDGRKVGRQPASREPLRERVRRCRLFGREERLENEAAGRGEPEPLLAEAIEGPANVLERDIRTPGAVVMCIRS